MEREDSKSTEKYRSRHDGDLSSVDHEIQRTGEKQISHTHTKGKRNGSDRNIIFGILPPSTLEIGLYLSPEYRYVNSEIRPHYLFFLVPFYPSFYLGPTPLASSPRGRRREQAYVRGFVSQDKTRHSNLTKKKGYNGIMEVCNVYKLQGYFYMIGMNNLTTNNPPSRCS